MWKSKNRRYKLDQSPFYCLESKDKLAKLLHISPRKLKFITSNIEDSYLEREKWDEKRSKSICVEEPKPALKHFQKRIQLLLKRVELPDFVHGPAQKRSYISNAKAHTNARVVRELDITKYFPSTSSKYVYLFFHKQMKCSSDVARILTCLSTFKGHLPTGGPLSPLLAYFSHADMWKSISELVREANCSLTVYVDDITISGENVPDSLIWKIKKHLFRHGLRSNNKKEKHYINKPSYEITGVIVSRGRLRIPNRQHLKIYRVRQAIRLEKDPEKNSKLKQSLHGLDSQARQVNLAVVQAEL